MADAFASSVAQNLLSKLGEYLFAPIGRQFGYVLCYKSHIEDLKRGVEKLETVRERMQHSVQIDENNGKLIEKDIKIWLERVDNEAKQARNMLKDGESPNNYCFCGWLPNPRVRHPIGRKVNKMTQVMKELYDESRNGNFQNVSYERTPIGIVTDTTSTTRSIDKKEDVLESRAKITKDVMKALADDNVYVIGVHGPGGVGKSKLLKDIEMQVKEKKLFHEVARANVSRNLDLKRIQGEIAHAIGLELINEETTLGRANLLCNRLKSDPRKNILIILDDLWNKLELKDVGIPCGDGNKVEGCKLLLSSRKRNVLCNDMDSDREFQLKVLDDGEALRLFERIVGDKVKNREFQPMVDGVVKNCGGLPLLILLVAKKLKKGHEVEWRNALTNKEWSQAKSIVEQSYNDLEDERIKSLFLVCALASGRISIRDSLVYCVGLGLFKKFKKTIENARDRLIEDFRCLQGSSLLLDSDDVEWFRMHDIFVEVAISIASTEWNALIGREDRGFKEWSKEELQKCTAISFPYVAIDELPDNLDCPNLRVLLLCDDNQSLKIPDSIFENMAKLQVLDFTGFFFTSLPSSIGLLENLKSLYLEGCHLGDVAIIGKLTGLQFLSFRRSTITRLPEEIGELIELRFLDLRECLGLKVIEPSVLGNLVNLEELYMGNGFDQWEAEDEAPRNNASLVDLKKMEKLSTLEIAIPHFANLSRDLPFGKLKKHKIQIGDVWNWWGKYMESRTLKLKLDSGNLLLEGWVSKCLQKTQDLHLDGLQHGIDSIHNLCVDGFQDLKHLHVQNSPSFQYVLSIENVQCTAFNRLESLFVNNLNNLEKICRGHLTQESFSKLKIVKVDNCGKVKHLLPLSMKRIISQLEEVEISRCCLMQQIVIDEDKDEIDDDTKLESCKLRSLTLQNLSKMASFCKTADHSVNFFNRQQLIKLQSLEVITIERCRLIQGVFDLEGPTTSGEVEILSQLRELTLSDLLSLRHIWRKISRRTLCCRNLRTLKVQNCGNLRFLFSSSMAKELREIRKMEIASCELMEEIINAQEEESEEDANTDTLEFPLLTSLSIEELPNLRTFSYGKHLIHCPSLTRLTISECPNMMTLSLFEGKQQSMIAYTSSQQTLGSHNSDLSWPIFFNEKVHFPSLEELEISSMCKLKRIWPNQLCEQSFCKLKFLTVRFCENLLHLFPSNSKDKLQSLNKIEVFECPSLEALFEPVGLLGTESMEIAQMCNVKKTWIDELASNAFSKLETLRVEHCEKLAYIFSSDTILVGFRNMKELTVTDCGSLEMVFQVEKINTSIAHTTSTFQLRKLNLQRLPKMKHVWSGNPHGTLKFECLQCLEATECKSLQSLFPSSVAKSMTQLEQLLVSSCGVEEIIVEEDGGAGTSEGGGCFFPQLTELILAKLPKLRSFYKNSHTSTWPFLPALFNVEKVEFPSMKSMNISHMDNMEKIRVDELVSNTFSKLKTLIVEYCEKLSFIFSSQFVLARFRNLEKLVVTGCSSLEMLFQVQEFSFSEAHSTSTLRLRELVLIQLPKIKHVWSELPQGALTFGHLRCMKVEGCESLKSLFPSSVAKSMTQLENLDIIFCGVEDIIAEEDGGLGTSVGDLFFPRLTNLGLYDLPQLRCLHRNSHTSTWPLLKNLKVRHCSKVRSFSFASEIQSWQGTTINKNQPPLFSVEKVIPHLEHLSLAREDVEMMQHYIFGNLKELCLICYHDTNVAFPSNFLLQGFPNLEELHVHGSSFEEIFREDAFGHGGKTSCGGLSNVQKPLKALENLKHLYLSELRYLRRVWKDGSLMAEILKQIEVMDIRSCPSLSIVFPSPISFQSLTGLKVENCAGLVHLGTCSAMTSLVHLTQLILKNCQAMEDVVIDDENGVEEISFPKLQWLTLDGLQSLESFSSINCAFTFPSLVEFLVTKCPKINIFCRGALRTPKLKEVPFSH